MSSGIGMSIGMGAGFFAGFAGGCCAMRGRRRGAGERHADQERLPRTAHGGVPRNIGCERKVCSHPLGEVPCSTVGPAWVTGVALASAVMTSRNLFMSACPTVVVPFATGPSRFHRPRSVVTAQATYVGVRAEGRGIREARTPRPARHRSRDRPP